jgi:hypothetical protein
MYGGSPDNARGILALKLKNANLFLLHGKTPAEFFGTFAYVHQKSGRKVTSDILPFHNWAFQEGLLHAENLGGDIELMADHHSAESILILSQGTAHAGRPPAHGWMGGSFPNMRPAM